MRQMITARIMADLGDVAVAGSGVSLAKQLRAGPYSGRAGNSGDAPAASGDARRPYSSSGDEVPQGGHGLRQDPPLAPGSSEAVRPCEYSRGFRHGVAVAAADDVVLTPIQKRFVDPAFRPDAQNPRAQQLYDVAIPCARGAVADRTAQWMLESLGCNGTTGFLGAVLGGVAYTGLKHMVTDAAVPALDNDPAPAHVDANGLQDIIYDDRCAICLEDLIPGNIVVLVHPPSGHACVCDTCYGQPRVSNMLRARGCPLCRRPVARVVRT